jgi:hypothetical protein
MKKIKFDHPLEDKILEHFNKKGGYISSLRKIENFIMNFRKKLYPVDKNDEMINNIIVIIKRNFRGKNLRYDHLKKQLDMFVSEIYKSDIFRLHDVFNKSLEVFLKLNKGLYQHKINKKITNKMLSSAYSLVLKDVGEGDYDIPDVPLELDVVLNYVDKASLSFLLSTWEYYLNKNYQLMFSDNIIEILKKSIELGLDYIEITKIIKEELLNYISAGQIEGNLEVLFSNILTSIRTFSAITFMSESGIEYYEIKNPMDERTCEVCAILDGTKIPLSAGLQQMTNQLNSLISQPDRFHRWISKRQDLVNLIGNVDEGLNSEQVEIMRNNNFVLPPFHGRCYDYNTQIYVKDRGFLFFDELDGSEEVLTCSLPGLFPEYQKIKRLINYKYDGKMLGFLSKNIDLLVTPDHDMLHSLTYQGEFKLIQARQLPLEGFMLRWDLHKMRSMNVDIKKMVRYENEYNNSVYCVEVEKHNTLIVKRNDKTMVCGNCRCVADIIIDF